MNVTFAATQFACSPNAAENLAAAEHAVREAAAKGGQVILLQELFETPYFCKDHLASHFDLARPIADSPVVKRFQALARELSVVLPLSVFERSNNAYFNSLAMIDADGEVLGVYRKSHIPEGPGYHEKYYFAPGDTGFCVWETRYGKLGVERGQKYEMTFYGSSFIADSTGAKVAEADRGTATVITATFDLAKIRAQRHAWGVFRDRRPDLYTPLLTFDGRAPG